MSDKNDINFKDKSGNDMVKFEFRKRKRVHYKSDLSFQKRVSDEDVKKKQEVLIKAQEEEKKPDVVESRPNDLESQRKRAAFFGDRKLMREIRAKNDSVRPPFKRDFQKPPFNPNNPNRPPRSFGNNSFGGNSNNNLTNSRPPFRQYDPSKPRVFDPSRPRPPFDPNRPRPAFNPNRPPLDPNRAPKIKMNEFRFLKPIIQSSPVTRKQVKKPTSGTSMFENSNKGRKGASGQQNFQIGHRFLGEINSPEDVEIDTERARSISSFRRLLEKRRSRGKSVDKVVREIIIFNDMPILSLAHSMAVSIDLVIAKAARLGLKVTKEDKLSADEAYILVEEFGHKCKKRVEILDTISKDEGEQSDYVPRAPVVTVVGHVDHGKTSLLDALRSTQITASESGGITQGIGASQVYLPDGRFVTFIDTPGHQIFTEMRARGVNITDIVLLIIAADDGIKDQTVESIQHAQAANACIIVVITKVDKPGANLDKIKQMLMSHNIVVESLGGDVPDIEVSAKTGHNLKELMELILLQGEMLDLKANPKPKASGSLLECYMDKNLGATATVLVRNGTLRKGDTFLSGSTYGRVRLLSNWKGENVSEAGPSVAVKVSGFMDLPASGDDFIVMPESSAKEASLKRKELANNTTSLAMVEYYSINDIWSELTGRTGLLEMNFLIKADSSGSCEAISLAIEKFKSDKVKIKILLKGIGGVNDSDILLAKASKASIIAFKTEVKPGMMKNAEVWGVRVRRYDIIYQILDDIDKEINRTFAPKEEEVSLGRAEVREIFSKHKIGTIAGCIVTEGIIKRDAKCILWRNGLQIYTSTIQSIRQFRDDKRETKAGQECGIMITKFADYHVGDVIECMHTVDIVQEDI